MHPRIWKWDAISTYLLKTVVYAVTPLSFFVSMVVLRMISPKTGFLRFGKVLVNLINSYVFRTLSPYRFCTSFRSLKSRAKCSVTRVPGSQ